MITIRTAKHQRVIELQVGSKYRAPLSKVEAEQQAEAENYNHTHVAVCEGVKPVYATISGETMLVRQSNGFDDYWEESIAISSEKDAMNKLAAIAADVSRKILGNL